MTVKSQFWKSNRRKIGAKIFRPTIFVGRNRFQNQIFFSTYYGKQAPPPGLHWLTPGLTSLQHTEQHCALAVQGTLTARQEACAKTDVGATTEEIRGKAITDARPIRRITSRRERCSNLFEISSFSSSRFSFLSWSKASQTKSSLTDELVCFVKKPLISETVLFPLHFSQTNDEVWFKQKTRFVSKSYTSVSSPSDCITNFSRRAKGFTSFFTVIFSRDIEYRFVGAKFRSRSDN